MMRLIGLVLLIFITGCSQSDKVTLHAGDSILAFGDSLTVSVGAKSSTYPQQLAQLTGLEVIASGVSGEQTAQGLERFKRALDTHQVQAVVLLEGGNDFLRNQDSGQTKANLGAMITHAQSKGIAVILVAVPTKSLFLSDAPLYQQLSEQYQVVLVADILSELLGDNRFKSDAIHLNDQGYRRLALAIADVIEVER
ncbi:Arylesterase precursor (plasmid) [Pseudoalteromonas sp. THAF3]|uniref:GDSL-type esterase/lipase family protein n=1 Tax=Pseudoalteromonas sp. THAF3 TaxID=2587843 RepID=UPI001267D0F8|nr:GDSL-type esterase/lipase family protein [Pseudoalteromonas sp. THAF3]QFU06703.1 Arylesterase precursor [Pseudoalteromonas sp. THAF3]